MLSIPEIYKKRHKDEEGKKADGVLLYILRFFSFPFTIIAYYLRITPNQVSLFALLVIATAAILISINDYALSIWGCVLFCIWFLLDLSDGELARLTNAQSIKGGEYIEMLNHDISMPLIHFALGMKAFYYFNSVTFIYLGFFTALFVYFTNLLRLNKYRVIIRLMQEGKKIRIPERDTILGASNRSSIFYLILSLFDNVAKIMLCLLALSIFNLLHYAIFFYAPFIFIIMIAKLYIEYKSGFKEFGLE